MSCSSGHLECLIVFFIITTLSLFQFKTFVTSAKSKDKVARIRAQLLHTLYELGKDEHSFHLRFKGQILRDAFCLMDYDIKDNAVVTMVPVGKSRDVSTVVKGSSLPLIHVNNFPSIFKKGSEHEFKILCEV